MYVVEIKQVLLQLLKNVVEQVMVPHTRAPGIPARAGVNAAAVNAQTKMIVVGEFQRLLEFFHGSPFLPWGFGFLFYLL
jgi:hypothetical protein